MYLRSEDYEMLFEHLRYLWLKPRRTKRGQDIRKDATIMILYRMSVRTKTETIMEMKLTLSYDTRR